MKRLFQDVFGGLKSLYIGMKITLGQFFKPIVTVQYPRETNKIPARFRGHIELVRDPSTGRAICFACKLCERACPSDCISVDGAKLEGAKKKSVTSYTLDFTKCSLCGSCVEACRDGAIQFSREYNRVTLNKEELIMDLFKKLEMEAKANPVANEGVAAAASAPAPEQNRLAATPAAVKLDPARATAAAPETQKVDAQ